MKKPNLPKLGLINLQTMILAKFMCNDDHLWDDAKDNQDYVVGVMEGTKDKKLLASKHYFQDGKKCTTFMHDSMNQGKAIFCTSRNKHYFI